MRLVNTLLLSALFSSLLFHGVMTQPTLTFTPHSTGFNGNSGPGVAYYNSYSDIEYQMYYQDPNGNGIFEISASPGSLDKWAQVPGNVGGQDSSSPINAVVFNGTVNVFYRDSAGNAGFWMTGTGHQSGWSSPEKIGFDLDHQPGAAVAPETDPKGVSYPGRILVVGAHPGANYGISYSVIVQGTVITSSTIKNELVVAQSAAPCAVWFQDYFYVFYREKGSPYAIKYVYSQDGVEWNYDPVTLGYTTAAGPAAGVFNYQQVPKIGKPVTTSILYVFFQDSVTGEALYIYSTDGNTFSAASTIGTGMFIGSEPTVTAQNDQQDSAGYPLTTQLVIAGLAKGGDAMNFVTATLVPPS